MALAGGPAQLVLTAAVARRHCVERMTCPSADQLRAIPEVLAIAYDRARSPAVEAAVRGGLVDSLVTHASLARTLLEGAEDADQLP